VLARFPHIKRLIVVADRGLLSLDNVDELAKISLPDGNPLEFILAVPGRRYGDLTELLAPIQARACAATQELIEETRWQGWRLVVVHDPQRAKEQTQLRRERIAMLQEKAQQWAGKLDGQDASVKAKGRKLSDSGANARLYHAVCEAHLSRIVKVDLKSDLFSYAVNEGSLAQAELMDGKLLLVSNVADLSPAQLVQRYPLSRHASATEVGQERTESGKSLFAIASNSAAQRQHQCGRAHHGHLHHQHTAGQRAGRTQSQEAHPRRSNVVAVVAAERLASIQIRHLKRLVSNSGTQDPAEIAGFIITEFSFRDVGW